MIIYCDFRSFYWYAQCGAFGGKFESKSRYHGSARQAADEVVAEMRQVTGFNLKLRRLSPKTYEVSRER